MRLTRLMCTLGVVLASMPQIGKALPPVVPYRVTDLGVISGADSSYANGVNDLGYVTGGSNNHIFLWTAQTGMQDLGGLAGYFSSTGVAINNNGQIAATAQPVTFPPFDGRAVRATTSTLQNLGTLGGTYSTAYGIDATGRVAGFAYTSAADIHAYRSTTGASLVDIDSLGGNYSLGYGINASGQVVGQAYNSQQQYHAFLWTGSGSMQDLSTLGGTQSQANDISDSGIIVGDSSTTNNAAYHAFIIQNGVMTDLGSLTTQSSYGYAVNNLGQVIGSFTDGDYGYPYLWDSTAGMRPLNSLLDPVTGAGWTLLQANDINNVGQIVGYGFHNGVVRGYLLTPVPEPSAIALLATVGAFFGLRTGRRAHC
jgi:probable HAF family extracellular repeat protein